MSQYHVTQMHIEAARNATDDFNLFHDKKRWSWLKPNPFGGPIALGFQLACFIEHQVDSHRQQLDNALQQKLAAMRFSHYELNFAGVVRPDDEIGIQVREGKLANKDGIETYTNRVALTANNKKILLGSKREANSAAFALPTDLPDFEQVIQSADRQFIGEAGYFIKRKYMIVGNAKNFLLSAFAEQTDYIDEFVDMVTFPQTYPLSLISSALLERAQAAQVDLIKQPMVYVNHKLSIDKELVKELKSNNALHILVGAPHTEGEEQKTSYHCVGLLSNHGVLFQAKLQLMPLQALLK